MWNILQATDFHEHDTSSRYERQDLGTAGATPAGTGGAMGRDWQRQSKIPECGILDFAHWRAVAGFAGELWRLEKHPSPVLSLARQRGMGEVA
jgi:hypothetical protein